MIGKPVGITLFTWLGLKTLKLELPTGMSLRHLLTVGMIAGIGFTVALFVATAAGFKDPGTLDAVKMGALGSFAAAFISIIGARAMGIRPAVAANKEELAAETGKEEAPATD